MYAFNGKLRPYIIYYPLGQKLARLLPKYSIDVANM